jgi:hypothetical protein
MTYAGPEGKNEKPLATTDGQMEAGLAAQFFWGRGGGSQGRAGQIEPRSKNGIAGAPCGICYSPIPGCHPFSRVAPRTIEGHGAHRSLPKGRDPAPPEDGQAHMVCLRLDEMYCSCFSLSYFVFQAM